MAFERATPPALRWVVAFLGVCAVLGLWLGFKDQIRRNPPAWYTGAPEPTVPGTQSGSDGIREAVAFDPNAKAPSAPAATPTTPAKKTDDADEPETAAASPVSTPAATPTVIQPSTPSAPPASASTPAAPRPRPATPPPARPAPSADPVGDILDGQRPATQPTQPDVPY